MEEKWVEGAYYKPGGYSWIFLVEACRQVLQNLILFQAKNVIIYTRFQTWPLRNNVIITYKLEQQQKRFLKTHF